MDELIRDNATAFYVFDIGKLKSRIKYLRENLPEEVKLCYAVKANTFIIGEIVNDVDRFEVCSPGEEHICEALNVPEHMMVISGVYKTPKAIEKMVASQKEGMIYTVESITQFELLKGLSDKYSKKLKVLLRLTNDSQFGINEEDIIGIIEKREEYPGIDILGIQYFSGTQKTSIKKFGRELRHLDKFLCKLRDEYGYAARELEYGTGFPVAYFKDEEIDETALLQGFSELLQEMEFKANVTLELGRSIAACCGSYYTHIVDMKRNKGQNYLLVDGGMHQLVYFGQHMSMRLPEMSVVGKSGEAVEEWNICGSLCSMNDIIVKQVPLPEISIGDLLCFENTGAYCMTEGISLFLSRDIPAVYLCLEDNTFVCVREAYETMTLNTPNYERMNCDGKVN